MYGGYSNNEQELPFSLTKREHQVLVLAARGLSDKEIAEHLNAAQRTISVHLANIFNKLNVRNRVQAVVEAIRHGLLKLTEI